jgi:hypothetical protein
MPRGRPKNNNKHCINCGILLTLANARETKTGSGSFRSLCRDCERKKEREHKTPLNTERERQNLVFNHAGRLVTLRILVRRLNWLHTKRRHISRGVYFTERLNVVGMRATEPCTACGGVMRYDEHLERVCDTCSAVDTTLTTLEDCEFAGRQLKSYDKSCYSLRVVVNRDKEHDLRGGDDDDQDTVYTRSCDIYYTLAYSKRSWRRRKKRSMANIHRLLRQYQW